MILFVDSLDAPLPQNIDVSVSSAGQFIATFVTNAAGAIPLVPVVGKPYVVDFTGSRAPQTTLTFTGTSDPQTVLVTGYVVPVIAVPDAPTIRTSSVPTANPAATRTDIALTYGGKIQFTPNGDLAIVQDVPGDPACTTQHVNFAVQSSPRLRDRENRPISPPDDRFHPDYGSGVRQMLGQPNNETTRSEIRSRTQRTLALLSGIASDPAPIVAVVVVGPKAINLSASAVTTSGDAIAVPGISITPTGA